jgi:hypothetical protein
VTRERAEMIRMLVAAHAGRVGFVKLARELKDVMWRAKMIAQAVDGSMHEDDSAVKALVDMARDHWPDEERARWDGAPNAGDAWGPLAPWQRDRVRMELEHDERARAKRRDAFEPVRQVNEPAQQKAEEARELDAEAEAARAVEDERAKRANVIPLKAILEEEDTRSKRMLKTIVEEQKRLRHDARALRWIELHADAELLDLIAEARAQTSGELT